MSNYAEQNLVRGLSFLAERQSAIANNLANVGTSSFKRRLSIADSAPSPFQALLEDHDRTIRYTERPDWSRGVVRQTDNPFDISLDMDAAGRPRWMKVQAANGAQFYTRNGQLQLDSAGRLVNAQGLAVVDATGQPLQLPTGPEAPAELRIADNGQLQDPTTGAVFGQIGVFELDPSGMQPVGNSLFVDTRRQRPQVVGDGVQQGALEGSNVDSLQELVQMISVERSFAATQKALSGVGNMQSNLIQNILR